MVNPGIFRQYDIRGVWEKDLTPEVVELIGRGYASFLLRSINGDRAKIIGEVKCSQTLYDDIAAHGGVPIMWKTGHSLIKEKMKQEEALLAGEMSGHLFFKHRYFGFDDAIYASLRLLEIIWKAGKPYSTKALLSDVPDVIATPEIRFDCSDDIKFRIVEKAQNAFNEFESITIDGIRIKFDDGWALIRASNTQPVLVLRFEAPNENRLNEIRSFVEERLNKIIKEHKGR